MTSSAADDPEAPVQLASRTDVGQVRSANEDSCDTFLREDGTRLLVVADGMGGHRGGATASRTTVETIGEIFEQDESNDPQSMLEAAIVLANSRVFEMGQGEPDLEGMGTTVVTLLLDPDLNGVVAHVGDSRAYRYRRGQLEPITTDHSVVAEMERRGLITPEEAAVHPRRNEILRSVGVLPEVEVEVAPVEVVAGDRFLLCSDGLSGVVDDEEIAAIVQSEAPDSAVDHLIDIANERGGPDNITVQILSIPADESTGDPEATAPVELSQVGIEAIERKRRSRRLTQRLGFALSVATILLGAYLLVRLLSGMTSEVEPEPAPEVEDRFEIESQPPRRGVPR